MKTAKRIQLLLSPVLIAMVALMLAVVSFGWYIAELGDIEVESETVNITVDAPEYIEVSLSNGRDNYIYDSVNKSFTFNLGDSSLGYFGQTGEYEVDSGNVDRPYIVFYDMTITGVKKDVDVNCAYVDGLEIIKNEKTLVNESGWEVEESKFKVYFFTKSGGKLVNQSETIDIDSVADPKNITEYVMGIYFDDPIEKEFAYSSFDYYGAIYNLKIKFYYVEVEGE